MAVCERERERERERGKWLARSVYAKAAVPHTDRQADTHTHSFSVAYCTKLSSKQAYT